MTAFEKAKKAAEALENKKAENIEVLDVSKQTSLGDYFIIASCSSTVQVRACADEVEDVLDKEGIRCYRPCYAAGNARVLRYRKIVGRRRDDIKGSKRKG